MRTMEGFILITALLLCSISWISVSASEHQTVEVEPGGNVTLQCSNRTVSETQTDWFRLVNRTDVSCISSMYGGNDKPIFCEGFRNGKFKMSSNVSSVFLKINGVDLSDSGLYFCGFYMEAHTVITDVIRLSVKGYSESDDEACLQIKNELEEQRKTIPVSVTLGAVTLLLTVVVIVLAVKIRKCQTAANEEPQPERNKDSGSDDPNSSVLRFYPTTVRSRKPAAEREEETHVLYTAVN